MPSKAIVMRRAKPFKADLAAAGEAGSKEQVGFMLPCTVSVPECGQCRELEVALKPKDMGGRPGLKRRDRADSGPSLSLSRLSKARRPGPVENPSATLGRGCDERAAAGTAEAA